MHGWVNGWRRGSETRIKVLTEDEPWQRPSPHASSPPSDTRAERTVASARHAILHTQPRPPSPNDPPAYAHAHAPARRRPRASPNPSPPLSSQCPLRARRCVGARYRAARSARRRMRPIGRRRVALCACGLGAWMGRLVGRRARGVLRARGACACAAVLGQSPPLVALVVVVGKMTMILAFCWEVALLHLRFRRVRIHRMRQGFVSSTLAMDVDGRLAGLWAGLGSLCKGSQRLSLTTSTTVFTPHHGCLHIDYLPSSVHWKNRPGFNMWWVPIAEVRFVLLLYFDL